MRGLTPEVLDMMLNFLLSTAMICFGLISTGALQAQNEKAGGSPITVTGCLTQGDSANEYAIKDDTGKTYGLLASGSVDMKPHVGHKVTITGTPMKEPSASEKENTKVGNKEDSEHLRVSNLTMVSTSCP